MQLSSFDESLTRWKVAYQLLVDVTNLFSNACDSLLRTMPVDKSWLEAALSQLREEASSLELIVGQIAHSRVVIHREINTSTSLVPINVLPPEILSRILTFTPLTLYYVHGFHKARKEHSLVAVSSVCAGWRKLAIGTRSLWSYICMDEEFIFDKINSPAQRWAELWLDRSAGAPLTLHLTKNPYTRRPVDARHITSFLRPHISKAAVLEFNRTSSHVVEAVITLYGSQNPSTLLKELSVFDIRSLTTTPGLTWPVAALQDLRVLVLWKLPTTICPDMDVIAQILLNSPRLHTLEIRQSTSTLHNNNLPVASLRHLKSLKLRSDDRTGLGRQLSMLEPGTNELDVALTLPNPFDLKCSHEVRAFLERAKVTKLSLNDLGEDYAAQLCTYLDYTPYLRELSLSCIEYNNSRTFLSALLVTGDDGEALARYPNLRCLGLSRMVIDQEQLKRVIDNYKLSSIELGHEATFLNGPRGSTSGKDFLNWLRQRVGIVISVEYGMEENS
ncbi:hypothetical protein FRC12_017374 [Ceratobasidium sp. 428]|nr:hypothetical protein FRC12_017374 [Ceratobasidium sp. 428]